MQDKFKDWLPKMLDKVKDWLSKISKEYLKIQNFYVDKDKWLMLIRKEKKYSFSTEVQKYLVF